MLLLAEVLPHPQDQPLPHLPPQLHPHLQQDVDPLNGLMTNGVTMKTTMLIAIMMVELAVSTTSQVKSTQYKKLAPNALLFTY